MQRVSSILLLYALIMSLLIKNISTIINDIQCRMEDKLLCLINFIQQNCIEYLYLKLSQMFTLYYLIIFTKFAFKNCLSFFFVLRLNLSLNYSCEIVGGLYLRKIITLICGILAFTSILFFKG